MRPTSIPKTGRIETVIDLLRMIFICIDEEIRPLSMLTRPLVAKLVHDG